VSQYVSHEGDVVVAHSGVGYKSGSSWSDGGAVDADVREFLDQLTGLGMIERHDVRSTGLGVVLRFGKRGREEFAERSGTDVVIGQTINHRVECHQSRRREEARLAHRPTEAFSFDSSLLHQTGGSGQQRTGRCTQSLGKTGHHRRGRRGVLRRGGTSCDHSIEQPRTVEVDWTFTNGAGERVNVTHVEWRTARWHVGVLQGHHRHVRLVVLFGVNDVKDIAKSERATRVIDGGELYGGVPRCGTHFETHHVLTASRNNEVAGSSEDTNGDLVAHDARRNEDRRLLVDQCGEAVLQRADRWILAVAVVPDNRRRDSVTHFLRWLGQRVTSQVHSSSHGPRLSADFYTGPMRDEITTGFSEAGNVNRELGIRVVELTPEKVVLQVEVGPKVHQPYGILHGGVSALMAEGAASLGGAISVGPDQIVVGTELNCSHLRSMSSGVLTATATPIRKGRTVHVWAIALTDESDRMICISRCTLQVLKAPPAAKASVVD